MSAGGFLSVFAIGVEHALKVATDAREHRRSAQLRDQHWTFDRGFAIQACPLLSSEAR